MTPHFYNVNISWSQDRKGMMCSPELNADSNNDCGCIEVATPPEFPKGIPGIWSPEHLYTVAISSCLMTTFLAIAENFKLDFISFQCNAKGKLDKADGQFMMTEVLLEPKLVIRDETDREKALKVLQKSEAACLISNSVKSTVRMTPSIEVSTGA